jgi:hypothetical protein
MSIPVELPALAGAIVEYGAAAFFLTTGDDGRAHVAHVATSWHDDRLVLTAGRSSRRNAAARPATVLLFAPVEVGGYSLIVDVVAEVVGEQVLLRPERAVLHRPAPVAHVAAGGDDTGSCGQDCRPL